MGDITPITNPATTGWTNAARDVHFIDEPNSTSASSLRRKRIGAYRVVSLSLTDWDNNDTISIRGAVAAAWQANTLDDMAVVTNTTGGWAFATAASDPDGWVHFLCRGSVPALSATTDTITPKGTAGYVNPYNSIYLNHRHATPDTKTAGVIRGKQRYKRQVFPFVTGSTSDRWLSQSARLCPGIVAVAWQGNAALAANRLAVTLDAAGDVIFTAPSGTATGYLWVWRG